MNIFVVEYNRYINLQESVIEHIVKRISFQTNKIRIHIVVLLKHLRKLTPTKGESFRQQKYENSKINI